MKYPEFWCILSTVHAREIVAFRDEICGFFGASFVVIYTFSEIASQWWRGWRVEV
jgi:hypothetical protein